jgi:antitoxin ParD1/3/4
MPMNVNLTPHLEDMVKQKVASGLYTSASEVVREALRLMEDQDRMREAKLQQLRRDIHDGLNSGQPISWNSEEIKRKGRLKRSTRANGHCKES